MFGTAMTLAVCLMVTAVAIVFMSVPFMAIAYSIFMLRDGEWKLGQTIAGIIAAITLGSIPFLMGYAFLGVWTL